MGNYNGNPVGRLEEGDGEGEEVTYRRSSRTSLGGPVDATEGRPASGEAGRRRPPILPLYRHSVETTRRPNEGLELTTSLGPYRGYWPKGLLVQTEGPRSLNPLLRM